MLNRQKIKFRFSKGLKILFVIILSILLVLEFFPTVYSNVVSSGINRSASDFGVLQALNEVIKDKEAKSHSSEIEDCTKNELDQIELIKYPSEEPELDYQVKSIQTIDYKPYEPVIFDALAENPIVNNTSILDFLFSYPLSYLIFTKSDNSTVWTQGMLRPTLFNPTRWESIDVDEDPGNGNEIRARFDLVIDSYDVQRPTLIPRRQGSIKIKGGFGLTMERLVSRNFPLEVFIAKSISYEGYNYIWVTGANFNTAPSRYTSALLAETIEFSNLTTKVINALLSGGSAFNVTAAEINGPYSLTYNYDIKLDLFDLMAGMVKYENQSLTDKNWLLFHLTPGWAEDIDHLPQSGELWLDSSNVKAPVDRLKWTAGAAEGDDSSKIPINLSIRYAEVREHLIFANVDLINLPQWFTLDIDYTKVVDGKNVTTLDYSGAGVLETFNYTSFYYPDYLTQPNNTRIDCTRVIVDGIPREFHVEMTTDIGRDINTTPYYNPTSGIAANIINNMIVRLASRFYRIGRYLKLATEGFVNLPSEEGWIFVNVLDEDKREFDKVEFYQTSSKYLDVPGNFIGFYNVTSTSNLGQNQTSSYVISGRLTAIRMANMSFGTPLRLELRALGGEPFKGLFLDRDAYIIADISNIPRYISITNVNNESYYSTIDPEDNDAVGSKIEQFTFNSRIDKQFIQFQLT